MKRLSFVPGRLPLRGRLRAEVPNIAASERRWVGMPELVDSTNNGASPTNNYSTGSQDPGQFRDWFEFSVPAFTAVTSTDPSIGASSADDGIRHRGDAGERAL